MILTLCGSFTFAKRFLEIQQEFGATTLNDSLEILKHQKEKL